MRFKKLRLFVGLTLILFIVAITYIIATGLGTSQIAATPQKTVAEQVQEVVQQQPVQEVQTQPDTAQQTQPDVVQQPVQPEPVVTQPIMYRPRTRAS